MILQILNFIKYTVFTFTHIVNVNPVVKPEKAVEMAICAVETSLSNNISLSRLLAIVSHESKWKHEAKGKTQDFGLGQIHCPSKYCKKLPTSEEIKTLLSPCDNLKITGEIIKRNGKNVGRYNPGNSQYSNNILLKEKMINKRLKEFRCSI
jgi:hypothetical protein